ALGDARVDQIAFARNAFAVDDIELGLAERRGDFVLHNFRAGARADDAVTFLDGLNAANIHADRGEEFQGATAGGGLGVAEHYADLFADLVDEDEARLRLRDDGGELAQRLRHQARLQTHLWLAHIAFEFGLRHERGDGINHDDVHRIRTD